MPEALIIHSRQHDPWFNLALEEYLMEQMQADESGADGLQAILYLWQNQDTVVIGRNQNAWAECLTGLLEAEGGRLARRSTGGGAVFHDLGNLNFSLILPRQKYNLDDNFAMILAAVASQGITAERSGRNDILAGGLKFSGNAFSLRQSVGLHHGTLLVHSDYRRVGRYLTVAPAKLQAKGVASVRSRITNLQVINPAVTVDSLAKAMENAFLAQFCSQATPAGLNWQICRSTDQEYESAARLLQLQARYASWAWRYGETIQFDATVEQRFSWGMIQLGFQVAKGLVSQAKIYSDALDSDFIDSLPAVFNGCRFHSAALAGEVRQAAGQEGGFGTPRTQMVDDLALLLLEQNW